jgi:hypothetical protein
MVFRSEERTEIEDQLREWKEKKKIQKEENQLGMVKSVTKLSK